jgi:hypothetical protein
VYPIHALERIHNRAKGQLFAASHADRLDRGRDRAADHSGSAASGAIIRVAGIEGDIRGMKHKRADGHRCAPRWWCSTTRRPTSRRAHRSQVRARMETLAGAILNLAGPGQKIAGMMPCTVIRPGRHG